MNDEKKIGPNAGGCWWCGKIGPIADLYFSQEFDTNAHEKCAMLRLDKDPNDMEAMLIYSCIKADHFAPYLKASNA